MGPVRESILSSYYMRSINEKMPNEEANGDASTAAPTDEDMTTESSHFDGHSWQVPGRPTPISWSRRAELESELSLNTQRHWEQSPRFVRFADEVIDIPSTASIPTTPTRENAWQPQPDRDLENDDVQMATALDCPVSPGIALTESLFFEWYPSGNGTLLIQDQNKKLKSIYNVNIQIIEERCPLLAMAFEESRSGPQLYLESLTTTTALPFLRFLYSGSYALRRDTEVVYEDVPTSLLLHCQLYRLGVIYDLKELKSQAYVNVLRQCEFGCSSPVTPLDLCATIRFVYEHLDEHETLKDAIINYCVACFLQHHLAQDEEFRTLAFELRPFHQDLCKNSINREFENETALAIIQMPFKPYKPEQYASREDVTAKRFDDVVFHFHSNDENDRSPKKRKRPEFSKLLEDGKMLPFPSNASPVDARKDNPASEEKNYRLGSKRRVSPTAASSSLLSAGISNDDRVALPLRPRSKALFILNDESDSEEEYYKVEKNACSSPASGQLASDAGFELVQGPSAVQDAEDSDSGSSTLVEVKHEDAEAPATGNQPSAADAASAENAWDSDSESAWTLV